MSNDLTKRNDLTKPTKPTKPEQPKSEDARSRLKHELMADTVNRLFGRDESIAAPDQSKPPRVILTCAAFASGGWDRAKTLQRELFEAAGGNLEMKLAAYGRDDPVSGMRPCRITKRWSTNPDDMAGLLDKATCTCGCYIDIHSALGQAVKEAEDRPLRAVIVVVDHFHDDQNGLDEAAIAANQLRRAGTKVFFVQLSDNSITSQKLQYLARVSGAVHFQFDPRTQEQQLAEMSGALAAFAAGGEAAVKTKGGQAASLLLQHLKQVPMSTVEEHARVLRGRE
jgi:hypothetical protein